MLPKSKFILCDTNLITSTDKNTTTFFWNGYEEEEHKFSLLKYIDNNSEHLREKYCSFISNLGQSRLYGKTIINHFMVEDFSYWWMSLLAEKSIWKTPSIFDAIKIIALEEILRDTKPSFFILISSNYKLNEVLSDYCNKNYIHYKWQRINKKKFDINLKEKIPHLFRGGFRFILISITWLTFLKSHKKINLEKKSSFLIFSYFNNLNIRLANLGKFSSSYWGDVPNLIRKSGHSIKWVHHFVPSIKNQTLNQSIKLIDIFNRYQKKHASHNFIDRNISLGIIFRVLKKWIFFIILGVRLRFVKSIFIISDSNMSLWPILESDWLSSLYGSSSVVNLFTEAFIEKELSGPEKFRLGLYLCENQSWEKALIYHWYRFHAKKLIAVPHSTISFWDLRFYNNISDGNTLFPDFFVANGEASFRGLLSHKLPISKLKKCEAQRYSYLAQPYKRNKIANNLILVLGDYDLSTTTRLLDMVDRCVFGFRNNIRIAFKPHPNCPIPIKYKPASKFSIVHTPLNQCLRDFGVVISSSRTSAAAEAYSLGLKLICILDSNSFNLSPLRGLPGVNFISSDRELLEIISKLFMRPYKSQKKFFYLDSSNLMWSELLKSIE